MKISSGCVVVSTYGQQCLILQSIGIVGFECFYQNNVYVCQLRRGVNCSGKTFHYMDFYRKIYVEKYSSFDYIPLMSIKSFVIKKVIKC